ncbi:hypothetical protein Bbelb_041610 [Branchiostoma belcheri]|nr:hypothetical protein Bbelb_041610 [Branchiostoma belcheri]
MESANATWSANGTLLILSLTNGKTSEQLRPLAECIRIAPTPLAHACAQTLGLTNRAPGGRSPRTGNASALFHFWPQPTCKTSPPRGNQNTKCAEHFFNSARPIDPWRETIKRAENWAEYLDVEYSLYRGKKDFLLGAVLSAATALCSSAVGVGSSNTPPIGRACTSPPPGKYRTVPKIIYRCAARTMLPPHKRGRSCSEVFPFVRLWMGGVQ